MENKKLDKNFTSLEYNSVNGCGHFSISKDNNYLKGNETCSCGSNYKEYWIRAFNKCEKCIRNEILEKENKELKEQLELAKDSHEAYLDKAENWHNEQLVQKEEENDQLRNKLQSLEHKFEELENKYSELTIKES